ncbi:hypothetical protein ACIRJM_38300 [Streptomyces sp. NPDC102405]|uniref:hypothetical protein n=1 Tax=Streptomyces sp. NPDC102405 TaxID=3366170 RepID=UPI0038135C47
MHLRIIRILAKVGAFMISALFIVGGLGIMILDRPHGEREYDYFRLGYVCTGSAKLQLWEIPTIKVFSEASTISGFYDGDVASIGKGRCVIRLSLPSKTYSVPVRGASEGGGSPQHEVLFRFEIEGHAKAAGWGLREFDLPFIDNGPDVDIDDPSITGGPIPQAEHTANDFVKVNPAAVDLRAICPEGTEISNSLPGTADQISTTEVRWMLQPAASWARATPYSATCVDPTKRWLVEHTTDFIVLGSGALLGLALATQIGGSGEKSEVGVSGNNAIPIAGDPQVASAGVSNRSGQRVASKSSKFLLLILLYWLIRVMLRRPKVGHTRPSERRV